MSGKTRSFTPEMIRLRREIYNATMAALDQVKIIKEGLADLLEESVKERFPNYTNELIDLAPRSAENQPLGVIDYVEDGLLEIEGNTDPEGD